MAEAATAALVSLVFGSLLGGALVWMFMGKQQAHLFLAWNPAIGSAGAFLPQRIKPKQKWVRYKTESGPVAFPLLPGYGASYGKDGKGSIHFGDLSARLPMKLSKTRVQSQEARGQPIKWTQATEVVRPDAEYMAAVLDDTREMKMARAAFASQKKGLPSWALYAAGGVVIFMLMNGGL